MNNPSQIGDVEFLVDRFVGVDYLSKAGKILHAVFVSPSGFRDEALRPPPRLTTRERRGPFADGSGHHHVIAKELKLIPETLFEFRQLGVVLVLKKIHLKPDDCLSFAMKREPRVVHAILIEVGENLIGMERPRGWKQHLVEMRGQSDARGVVHRIGRTSLLVLERL